MSADDPDITYVPDAVRAASTADFGPHSGQGTTVAAGSASLSPPVSAAQVGDYDILCEIARGGMGVVYKARHRRLGRMAAVKLIRSGQLADADEIRRFQVEAQAAAGLDHSGIVSVYEVGEQAGQHFMALAFIEGQSLWQRVKESPLPPKEAARILQAVADAIQFAHDRGIIHRDLKPQNILLTQDGQPKVTDFGLAKKQVDDSSLTATGQVLGTPSYMPPEQASGAMAAVGPLADIYSLGATLYCTLVGRPPFQAANPLDTLMQVLHQEPVRPRELNPSIPPDLETICLKCLEKDPRQRFASAREFANELGRFLRGEPILSRPISRAQRVWRWGQRNKVVAALSVTAMVLLVFGTVISTYFAVLASQRAKRAEEGTRIAVETLESVIFNVQERLREIPQAREARKEILQTAFKELEKLSDGQIASDRVDLNTAVVLVRFANMIVNVGSDETLGNWSVAEKNFRKALDIYQRFSETDPHNARLRSEWPFALMKAGDLAVSMHQPDRARELTDLAIEKYRALRAEFPDSLDWMRLLAQSLTYRGDVCEMTGDPQGALQAFREAQQLAQAIYDRDPKSPDSLEQLIIALEKDADTSLKLGDVETARELYRKNLARNEEYLAGDPEDPPRMNSVSLCYERQGEFELRTGNTDAAVDFLERSVDMNLQAVAADPKNRKYQEEMNSPTSKLAGLYHRLNRPDDAAKVQQRVADALQKVK